MLGMKLRLFVRF